MNKFRENLMALFKESINSKDMLKILTLQMMLSKKRLTKIEKPLIKSQKRLKVKTRS